MTGFCIWFTGLPSSGKTTISQKLSDLFSEEGIRHDLLDGDVLRAMYTRQLGFTKEDRIDNGKTVSFLASRIAKHNGVAVVSLVSPYAEMREHARRSVEAEGCAFIEVFVDAPVEECIKRDIKGLYKKAINGEIQNFTGINDPYEKPTNPDIHLKTSEQSIEECLRTVVLHLASEGLFPVSPVPRALYIGRWQPYHNGHDFIIRKKLAEGVPVLIAVRDTPIDEGNPFTVAERIAMIRANYIGEDVQVISMPDIESVNIGRNVGYAVNEYEVPADIKGISATQIRKLMAEKNFEQIRDYVPNGTFEFLKGKVN